MNVRIKIFLRWLLAALSIIGVALLFGCGDDDAAENNGGEGSGGKNNCISAETCKKVTIGGQTWMAENMNVETEDSWCYFDYEIRDQGCDKYGRLYTWAAAMKVCPTGWHLPSDQEWRDLIEYAGGTNVAGGRLKSKRGWNTDGLIEGNGNGTDEYGFSALPGGYSDVQCKDHDGYLCYHGRGGAGYWWTATEFIGEDAEIYAHNWIIHHSSGFMFTASYDGLGSVNPDRYPDKGQHYSVRCVKDNA